ncbi:MAG: serine hydrolase, partial [Verrucomicrobium sp.]
MPTALLTAALLASCNDASHVGNAVDALKAREKQLAAREEATLAHDRALIEKERQLAETAADIAKQREELQTLRNSLDEEILKARRQQEAALKREARGLAPKVQAERVMVVDASTGEVLFEKNADRKAPVASTQKLLTALLVVEDGNLDQTVTVEQGDTQCAPVRLGIKTGEQYSRRQLLTALMVKSSNDIAQALARDNAGSLESFAKKMNARAAELGMKDSRFVNPHGLPIDGQYST